MKRLHREDLYCWSVFSEDHNIDFHSLLWVRGAGNILVDPLPLSLHDETNLNELGRTASIIITNSDHVRDAGRIAERYGGKILGPNGERHDFPIRCADWLEDGDEVVTGLRVFEMEGSKTSGELALLLEETTLITGISFAAMKAESSLSSPPKNFPIGRKPSRRSNACRNFPDSKRYFLEMAGRFFITRKNAWPSYCIR